MSRIVALVSALAVLGLSAPGQAGDPQRGLEKSRVCHACHGRDGNQPLEDDYPRIGGQHFDYLVHALEAYRGNDREHAVMAGFASTLSDQDIRDLAAWYSRQDSPLTELPRTR